MSSTETSVLCGSCNSTVKTVANPKPDDQVTCTGCGKSDRFDKVIESVQAYATDVAAKYLGESIRKVASRSKFIKADIHKRPNRSFDWICSDMGL